MSEVKMPTQVEIVNRFQARDANDMFGFESHEYLHAIDTEHIKLLLNYFKPEFNPNEWHPTLLTRADVLSKMQDYTEFAWDKATGERGLSANRSIMHYIAWIWLAGDVAFSAEIEQMYSTNYHSYGKHILKRICDFYKWELPK